MNYANLHMHSTYSDGGFTPYQLTLIGKSLGYGAMVLTDHETDGGVPEFMRACQKLGMESLTGTELYGSYDGHLPHIVALDYDYDHPAFRAFIRERCELRNEFTRRCVERGIRLGFIHDFTWNDVLDHCYEGSWICLDQVIGAMKYKRVMAPEEDSARLRLNVFKGPEVDALEPAHPSAPDVLRVIRKAGGIAVLAHPNNKTHYVQELMEYGLNGIEVSHPDITPETERLAREAAETFGLYRCGGTDHTGALSCCGGRHAVQALHGISEEEFCIIKERRLG